MLLRSVPLLLCLSFCLTAQAQDAALRPKDVREMGKAGANAIPKLAALLTNPDLDIRLEAVKQIADIGTQYSLDPLILATHDNDAEMQIRATDGLVNFYLPGYVKTGIGASLRRVGTSIKGRFTDTNDQVIDPYVTVRPEVIAALGKLAAAAATWTRGPTPRAPSASCAAKPPCPTWWKPSIPKTRDVIYESLVALQKIRDESAGPRVSFRLHDLDPKVQIAAIETTGVLLNKAAVPDLIDVLNRASDTKVKRAALTAIAMLPVPRPAATLYAQYLHDKDDRMRAAAAEGYARLKNPADLPMLEKAWQDERQDGAAAFAGLRAGDAGQDGDYRNSARCNS